MEISIRVIVGAILCLVALLVGVMMISNSSSDSTSAMNGLIDWFNNMIGK